jgi:flagellar basal body-associated protein FliL
MKHKIKNNRKKLLKTFIQYGLHLWLIIFLCNIVVVYAVRFFLFASTDTTTNTQPTTAPKPTGPVVKVNLILPGISSEGGNLKPLHPERDISVNLYNSDANISDQKVNPIYSIKAKVTYDAEPDSPTYTQFINNHVDLGDIKRGKYQIGIHTQQTLLSVIKDSKSSSLGGKIFSLHNNDKTTLPAQTMTSGDIYPAGNNNNVMDINDYNMLTNCFSNNINISKCSDASYADLDDNGVVDGVDYNIMLLSFRTLKSLGYPIPAITTSTPITSTSTIPASNKKITPIIKKQTNASGGGLGFIILFIILLILGVTGFILFKLHLLKLSLLENFLKRIRRPGSKNNEGGSESNTGETNTGEPGTGVDSNIIEKSGYLKNTSTDTQTNDTWVTLADDNGVSIGLYHGKNVTEGFVKIKGTMQTDKNNKQYILINEIEEEK